MCSIYEIDENEYFPNNITEIIIEHNHQYGIVHSNWGLSIMKDTIKHARCETLSEKKIFKNLKHCVIEAECFKEYDYAHHKVKFYYKNKKYFYMAGLVKENHGLSHVIVTTKANLSVKPIHDRMPLILNNEQVIQWLNHQNDEEILKIVPDELKVYRNIEQMELFQK